jgi:hypothetical protein
MAKINTLTETDLATVKRANDALADLHALTVSFCGRHYVTDADIETLREATYNLSGAMQLFKLYLQRVNERARNGH